MLLKSKVIYILLCAAQKRMTDRSCEDAMDLAWCKTGVEQLQSLYRFVEVHISVCHRQVNI